MSRKVSKDMMDAVEHAVNAALDRLGCPSDSSDKAACFRSHYKLQAMSVVTSWQAEQDKTLTTFASKASNTDRISSVDFIQRLINAYALGHARRNEPDAPISLQEVTKNFYEDHKPQGLPSFEEADKLLGDYLQGIAAAALLKVVKSPALHSPSNLVGSTKHHSL